MQILAGFGVLFLIFASVGLIVFLSTWMPTRASEEHVYEKVSIARNEASGWYDRLSARVRALEDKLKDKS